MALIYIMSVICILTTLWLAFKTGKLSISFLDTMIKAGFRDKYPFDYEINLGWVLSELRTQGYRIVKHIDSGSDNPGVMLGSTKNNNVIEVRLNAPLFTSKSNSIIVVNRTNQTSIAFPDSYSESYKKLLVRFLEVLE